MLVRMAHQRVQLALLQGLVLGRCHALPGPHLLGQKQHLRRLGRMEVEGIGHGRGGVQCVGLSDCGASRRAQALYTWGHDVADTGY